MVLDELIPMLGRAGAGHLAGGRSWAGRWAATARCCSARGSARPAPRPSVRSARRCGRRPGAAAPGAFDGAADYAANSRLGSARARLDTDPDRLRQQRSVLLGDQAVHRPTAHPARRRLLPGRTRRRVLEFAAARPSCSWMAPLLTAESAQTVIRPSAAASPMSLRKWLPGKRIDFDLAVGVGTGRGQVFGPVPTTASTRPPEETIAPSSRRVVPACRTPSASAPAIDVADPGPARDSSRRPAPRSPPRRRASAAGAVRPGGRWRRRAAATPSGVSSSASTDFGLGITEAAVEFDHGRSARGDRQPGVEQPGERAAAPNQFGGNGFHDVVDDLARRRRPAATAAARRRPCRRCWARCRRRRPA